MRRLLSSYAPSDEVGDELLTIVRRFDELLVGQTDLPHLAGAAAEMLASEVCVLDLLNDQVVAVSPDGLLDQGTPGIGRALLQSIDAEAAQPGEAVRASANDRVWGAAILEHGQGRLGVVWTTKPEVELGPADDLVLERFAQAASMAIQHVHQTAPSHHEADPSALETLIVGGLDEPSLSRAVRATNLDAARRCSVASLALEPAHASVAVATAALGRALDRRRVPWRHVTVMNRPLIVVTGAADDCDAFDEAVEEATRTGWRLAIGVGEAVPLGDLDRSALQAREALAFAATDKLGGVSSYSSLGSLLLLTQIPRAALENDRDLAAIAGLERSRSGVDDLALLVAYCETASMRQTGERLFMHHSSVEYRLRRIEAMLGFSVATPTGRFRALLAATVHRLSQTTQR
jgi:PucR C-terminal helix-turn-helix domain